MSIYLSIYIYIYIYIYPFGSRQLFAFSLITYSCAIFFNKKVARSLVHYSWPSIKVQVQLSSHGAVTGGSASGLGLTGTNFGGSADL